MISHIVLVTCMSYDWLMVTKATTAPITAHGYQGNTRDLVSLKFVECQTHESNFFGKFLNYAEQHENILIYYLFRIP